MDNIGDKEAGGVFSNGELCTGDKMCHLCKLIHHCQEDMTTLRIKEFNNEIQGDLDPTPCRGLSRY